MGIDSHTLEFLIDASKSGIEFKNTITLGRQDLLADYNDIENFFKRYCLDYNEELITSFYTKNNQFSEPILEYLGATSCDSMDFSDFEKATVVHDLNKPVDSSLKQKFDTVIDGGTLEHVFNFPQAIRNCMEMVKVGGHFISVTPANNFMGHGFYQLSPELFYRVLSAENGFNIKKMIFCETGNSSCQWYAVNDPKAVAHRVGTVSAYPCYLMLIAQKSAQVNDIFSITPQQSDYANEWTHKQAKGNEVGRLWFWKGKTVPSKKGIGKRMLALLKYPFKRTKNYLLENVILNKMIYKHRDLANRNLFVPYNKKG